MKLYSQQFAWYTATEILSAFKITKQTLQNWRKMGVIEFEKNNSRHFRYKFPKFVPAKTRLFQADFRNEDDSKAFDSLEFAQNSEWYREKGYDQIVFDAASGDIVAAVKEGTLQFLHSENICGAMLYISEKFVK